jgi:putative endonuclease
MEKSDLHHVYILSCADGTYYTGCTQDLNDRLSRHQNGDISYTKSRLPVLEIFHCSFPDKYKAYEFEKYLKSGSGIAFRNKHLI